MVSKEGLLSRAGLIGGCKFTIVAPMTGFSSSDMVVGGLGN